MARRRYSDEDILKLLREIELKLADGSDVQTACRAVGDSGTPSIQSARKGEYTSREVKSPDPLRSISAHSKKQEKYQRQSYEVWHTESLCHGFET